MKKPPNATFRSGISARIGGILSVIVAWSLPLFPAVRINLDAATGQSMAWTSFAIASVGIGACCFYVSERLMEGRKFGRAAFYFALAMVFLAINLMQSIGNAAGHSEATRDDRSSQIQRSARIKERSQGLRDRRKAQSAIAGEMDPTSIESSIEAKEVGSKVWRQSEECTNVTSSASRSFCSEISSLKAKLAAAKKRDEIDAELKTLEGKDTGEVPSSLDPFADNIARFLSMFGVSASAETKVLITAGRDWGKAIGVELLALFGPAVLMGLFNGLGNRSGVAPTAPKRSRERQDIEEEKRAPIPLAALPGDGEDGEMLSFVSRHLERCEGENMKAGDVFKLWCEDCEEDGRAPGSQKAFSGRIRRYFQHDPNGGRPRYRNVRPKTEKPAIRMVVSNA